MNFYISTLIFLISFINLTTCNFTIESSNLKNVSKYSLSIRRVEAGLIRGRKHVTPAGVEGYVFLSIPVAEPPVDSLRFKKPIPRKHWKGVHNTTEYTVSCFWNSTITSAFTTTYNMSEDCIQLHVFTNENCLKNGGCAVIFYIHGGNFAFGTPLQFSQDTLVDNFANSSRNVIMVTASFRGTAFACLNLNWKLKLSADMNVGLHDIVFEMEWIKRNVGAFGGDPNRVTLMGHSGGATLVDYLAVSPRAQPLFNQLAIMSRGQQGAPFVPDRNQKASRMTSKLVGCTSAGINDTQWDDVSFVEDVVACLRNKTALEISSQQRIQEVDGYSFQSPMMDYGEDALIPTLYNVLDKQRTSVPVITGTVSKEFLDSRSTVKSLTEVDQRELNKWCYMMLRAADFEISESAIQECMMEYNTTAKSVHLYDDPLFYAPTIDMATSATRQGAPVYLYQFEYEDIGDAYISGPGLAQKEKVETPGHSMELIYLMGQHLGNFTQKDRQIQYLYSQIFVDFVNKGTPMTAERKWDQFDPEKLNYFVIDYPDPTLQNPGMRDNYHREAVQFWDVDLVKIIGPKIVRLSEEGYYDLVFKEDDPNVDFPELNPVVAEPLVGINWQLFFWILLLFFVITVVILVVHVVIASKRKQQYQQL